MFFLSEGSLTSADRVDHGDLFTLDWYIGLKCCLLIELGFWGVLILLGVCGYDSISSLLALLGGYEALRGDIDLRKAGRESLLIWLLRLLTLPLEFGSISDWMRGPIGFSTDDEARALAAARMASFESSFASFHALIRTGFLGIGCLPLSDAGSSGSTVDGTRPGSKCGMISS